MEGQLYLASPFGIENCIAQMRFTQDWGWSWKVSEYDGHEWHVIDSGIARSEKRALMFLSDALRRLSEYEPDRSF